jgi:hypothetical protein
LEVAVMVRKDKKSNVMGVGAALASDALSLFSVPGSGILSHYVDSLLERKRAELREIILQEIRDGRVEFEEEDRDVFIHVALRLSKAVFEGTAKENLRLLSRVIVELKRESAFNETEFARWEKVIVDLTKDEIFAVGLANSINSPGHADFWSKFKDKMKENGYDSEETYAISVALSRHGLMGALPVLGGVIFSPTSRMSKLCALARINS